MKKNKGARIGIAIICVLIAGVVAIYLYGVLVQKTPYMQDLFKAILVIVGLLVALIKILNGSGRSPLSFYEKAYKEELGAAFEGKPKSRKKLLCVCRLYNEPNYPKALKYLSGLLCEAEHRRDTVPVLLFTALCYTDMGIDGEAIVAYRELLGIDPNHAQAHSNLGYLLVRAGEFELALEHYHQSIALMPKNYNAYTNRANCYFRMGEYDDAISDATQALVYKRNGVEAAGLLAILYALRGDEENKKRYYHVAIASGKSPKDLNEAIEYYLSEQHIPFDGEKQ